MEDSDLVPLAYKTIAITIIIVIVFNSQNVFADRDIDRYNIDKCTSPDVVDYYKERMRMYDREGYVINCDDTLNVPERELNPCLANSTSYYQYIDKYIYHYDYKVLTSGELKKREEVEIIYADSIKTKIITKWISCGGFNERLKMEYDSNGSLILSEREIIKDSEIVSSRLEVWNNGKLVRTKYDNINRSIVQDKTPCDIKVLEKNETVIIRIDPEKELPALVQKVVIDSGEVYETIKYHWYPHCKKYHESKKAIASLNSDGELGNFIKDNENTLLYPLPYKYYLIIALCIIAIIASIIVMRKKRNAGKEYEE